jgi:hypothetical protein
VALKTPSCWKLKAYKNNINTHKKIVSHPPGGHQDESPPPPERLHLVLKSWSFHRNGKNIKAGQAGGLTSQIFGFKAHPTKHRKFNPPKIGG